MAAIELEAVTKQFGEVTALRDLDLTVEDGEIFGFLGPNGAGKSTTINILLDLVRADDGSIEVLGMDVRTDSVDIRRRTGVLPEGFGVYDRLTGRQHLEFAFESKQVDGSPESVLDRVGLDDAVDRRAGGYSTGMKQRLALGMALVGEPDLLILDEPSTGLDPNGAREMRHIVRQERDRGATVFFSSHSLSQVEAVCDRVGILRDGELVAIDSIEGLRAASDVETTLEITVGDVPDGVLDSVRALDGVSEVRADGTTITVSCEGDVKMSVLDCLAEEGADVGNFTTSEASLEELFASYTGGEEVEA